MRAGAWIHHYPHHVPTDMRGCPDRYYLGVCTRVSEGVCLSVRGCGSSEGNRITWRRERPHARFCLHRLVALPGGSHTFLPSCVWFGLLACLPAPPADPQMVGSWNGCCVVAPHCPTVVGGACAEARAVLRLANQPVLLIVNSLQKRRGESWGERDWCAPAVAGCRPWYWRALRRRGHVSWP